jgi:hypothetical protein
VLQELFPNRERGVTLALLSAGFARALGRLQDQADEGDTPKVWFADENAFDLEKGEINFRIADADAPPEGHAGTVKFTYGYEENTLVFDFKVVINDDPMLEEKIAALLKRFERIERIQLPDFGALSQAVGPLKVELSHPKLELRSQYVTFSGKLRLEQ